MSRSYQIAAVIVLFVVLTAGSIWIKHKKCEWMAPDHIGYCMFFTK